MNVLNQRPQPPAGSSHHHVPPASSPDMSGRAIFLDKSNQLQTSMSMLKQPVSDQVRLDQVSDQVRLDQVSDQVRLDQSREDVENFSYDNDSAYTHIKQQASNTGAASPTTEQSTPTFNDSSSLLNNTSPLQHDKVDRARHHEPIEPRVSLSLLYPDTAPRSAWHPQVNAWIKKNHPSKLREITQCSALPRIHAVYKSRHHHHHHHRHTKKASLQISPHIQHELFEGKDETRNLSQNLPSPPPESPVAPNPAAYHHSAPPPSPPESETTTKERYPASPNNKSSSEPLYTVATFSVSNYSGSQKRRCISCGSDQSPCWRPSWSASAGQLCNSCGLRYKKTGARCMNEQCGRIPAKGEWVLMQRTAQTMPDGRVEYSCLSCGGDVEASAQTG